MIKLSKLSLLNGVSACIFLFVANACVMGAPSGFSKGDRWSVPLIAPLENDVLLVPVSINGKGPYVFMVDPDSPTSAIESSIKAEQKLYAVRGYSNVQNEQDHLLPSMFAQVNKLTLGDLSVRYLKVRVFDDGIYWSGGRRIRGILGRDVISDSLIYSFDRDRGMMNIATQGNMTVPQNASPLDFSQSYGSQRRYLSKVTINGKHKATMHMDLGAVTSMLWDKLFGTYKLPSIPYQTELLDEYGTKRKINKSSIIGVLETNNIKANAIRVIPYLDKRLDEEDLDGVIGQNFWAKFHVIVNWHQKKFWIQKRDTNLARFSKERIERWGDALDDCPTPACITVSLQGGLPKPLPVQASTQIPVEAAKEQASTQIPVEATKEQAKEIPTIKEVPTKEATTASEIPNKAPTSPEPPAEIVPQPYVLTIERSAPGVSLDYDVVIGPVDANGQSMELPLLLVSFRAGVMSLRLRDLNPAYAAASNFIVLDINPVGTRGCEGRKCIFAFTTRR